jgi:hypothetical protein
MCYDFTIFEFDCFHIDLSIKGAEEATACPLERRIRPSSIGRDLSVQNVFICIYGVKTTMRRDRLQVGSIKILQGFSEIVCF